MVLIRLVLLAAAIAILTSPAQAQVIPGLGGSAGGPLTCNVEGFDPGLIRPEGLTERIGDLVIICYAGTQGATVPTVNITVTLNNTIITSRVFGNGLSEALLLIDEPGGGPMVGPGGVLPQMLCTGGALGAGLGGCVTQPGTVDTHTYLGPYVGAVLSSNPSVVPNIFQGVVSGNQVVFNGIPLLAPVTAGFGRAFRITNIRVNAAQLAIPGAVHNGQVQLQASVSMSGGIQLANPVRTVGYLYDGLAGTSVRNVTNSADGASINLAQCAPADLTPGAVLRFSRPANHIYGLRTRVYRTSPVSGSGPPVTGAGTPPNSTVVTAAFQQNVPGLPYLESESGFIFPVTGGIAGLADFGTRLKAAFQNVPPGVSLYVSTININPRGRGNTSLLAASNLGVVANAVAAGNLSAVFDTIYLLAGLVSSDTATAAPGESLPLVSSTATSSGIPLYGPLPVDANGTATAVWEILTNEQSFYETVDFAVFYTSTGNVPSATPPGSVSLGYAPSFANPTASTLLSRFAPPAASTTLINISPCYTLGLVSSANPSSYRQSITITATASGTFPAGSVTFTDGPTTLGTVAISNGQAALTTNGLSVGTHAIAAALGIASASVTHTVNKAATTTTLASQPAATADSPTTLVATVTPAFSGTPTGTVTFRNGSFVLTTVPLDSSGVARSSTSLAIGDHTITAAYNGDANFLASSGAQRYSVDPIATSVSTPVLVSGTPAPGQPLTLLATVTAGGAPVTGTLTFRDSGTVIAVAELNASGSGTITTSTLGAGAHLITASYSGNTINASATSPPLFLTIKATPTVTLTSSLNPSTPGAAITITAVVASPAGAPAPTGSVNFLDGSTALGSVALNASGQAVLTLASGLAAGDHTITATYNGDPNLTVAAAAPLVQRVTRIPTTTTLAEGIDAAGFFLNSMVSAERGIPTGSVEFRSVTGGTALGAAPLTNGFATLVLPFPLPVGHTIEAAYTGDTACAPSSSTRRTFIAAVNGFSMVPGFAPDGVATIFGSGLAASTEAAPGLPLPTTLGGIEVRVVDANGRQQPAMLYYVSPQQINFVIPPGAPIGPARIVVVQGEAALSISVPITRSAPGLASADGAGSGTAAAQLIRLHADGTQDPPVAISGRAIPYAPGDRLFLVPYGTGFRHAGAALSCSTNGQSVPVLFAGAHSVYPGLDQINLEIPADLHGVISIVCSGKDQSSNRVTVNLQ